MSDLLTTPAKIIGLVLGFLYFNKISAIDIVEVLPNDIEMNSNDGELIFASVVSAKSLKYLVLLIEI